MTFGAKFPNDSSYAVISDKTYNPAFVGKAAYISATDTGANYAATYKSLYWAMTEYRFRIWTPNRPTPFVYVPQGTRFSISGIQNNGNGSWDIIVDTYPAAVPEIYVFTPVTGQTTSPGAWGMAIYDANGQLSFNGDKNHLVIQQVVTPAVPACVRETINQNNTYLVARCSGQTATAIDPPPAKAAIFAPSHGSAGTPNLNSQLNNDEYYNGTFMLSGSTLYANWVHAAQGGSPSDFTYSYGTRPIVIIDGAIYD